MDLELIYIIVGIAIISLFIIAFLVVKYKGKKQEDLIDESSILALIEPENVVRVEFVRNKIVFPIQISALISCTGYRQNFLSCIRGRPTPRIKV